MTIKVLVVDDSPSMQQLLKVILEGDPQITVVGLASEPHEARAAIKLLNPDVITLDVEMPGMNGIDFLEKIMKLRPMPVVMISNNTDKGTETSLEALMLGAVCCLPKPRMDDEAALQNIREMVKQAASTDIRAKSKVDAAPRPVAAPVQYTGGEPEVITIGSSTGGVEALTKLFSEFPEDCPPTVVTQHMPARFTKSFAERLDRTYSQTVVEVEDGIELRRGHIYIAPGNVGHTQIRRNGVLRGKIVQSDPILGHMPAVDELFRSAAEEVGSGVNAVILTGMGTDGAEGMLKLKQAGARTIAQDKESSLIYGMPGAAVKMGAANEELPLNQIATALFGNDAHRRP